MERRDTDPSSSRFFFSKHDSPHYFADCVSLLFSSKSPCLRICNLGSNTASLECQLPKYRSNANSQRLMGNTMHVRPPSCHLAILLSIRTSLHSKSLLQHLLSKPHSTSIQALDAMSDGIISSPLGAGSAMSLYLLVPSAASLATRQLGQLVAQLCLS